ncbi:TetR/AcrR family transcriptional regulator [Ornithinimicrobium pratense]|uniref:TetR/AcrR family transcriptional regulator n=1 Tax=Ornithinimicrobium pratense TaxID=2593973 RepID=A0A5J6V5F1_9MICO|nr:TetR/AcrR family transcriptional regulator [Ornithinimicrobium pratense]QFG68416.1 TetR/AcrR family transcriptional regulator [Ornithinimicrobium pratense]
MAGARERSRARTRAAILAAARTEIAIRGGGGLSMRAVAREVGLVSSAVYRYFPTREALLTAMIVESYGNLDAVLTHVCGARPDRHWEALAMALREWGRARPHEFQLIYGTPVPGYVAPPQTIEPAAAVARHFLRVGAGSPVPHFNHPTLLRQMTSTVDELDGAAPSGAAAVLAELAALVGFVSVELAGHFIGTADPADELYAALINRQTGTLRLKA